MIDAVDGFFFTFVDEVLRCCSSIFLNSSLFIHSPSGFNFSVINLALVECSCCDCKRNLITAMCKKFRFLEFLYDFSLTVYESDRWMPLPPPHHLHYIHYLPFRIRNACKMKSETRHTHIHKSPYNSNTNTNNR